MIAATVSLLAVYLILLVAIGFWAGAKTKANPESFYVADRQLNWAQEGLSVFSSAATGAALLGTLGIFYGVQGPILGYAVGYSVFAPAAYWLIGSRLRRMGAKHKYQTQAQFLGHYFESRFLGAFTSVFSIALLMVYSATLPIAVALLMNVVVGGSYALWVILFLVVALSYAVFGGLRAVATTDVYHGVLLVAFLVALAVGLVAASGGLSDVFTAPQNDGFRMIANTSDGGLVYLPWLILITFSVATMPDRSHRMFSAKDDSNLRRAVVLMSISLGLMSVVFLLSSMALNLAVPGVADTDTVLLQGLQGQVDWLVPLLVVSVWGASIAAASMHMLTMANIFVVDFVKPRSERRAARDGRASTAAPAISAKRMVRLGQYMMVAAAVVSLAVSIKQPIFIWTLAGISLSGFAQLGILFFFTLYWRGVTKAGAISGLLVGLSLSAMWTWWVDAPFGMTYPAILALVPNAIVLVGVSLATRKKQPSDARVQASPSDAGIRTDDLGVS